MKTVGIGRIVTSGLAVLCGLVSLAGEGVASNRTFVHLKPERNSFWHTATNATLTLPIPNPREASRATLTVEGVAYSRVYRDISSETFTLSLPSVREPMDENVYRLSLAFDDGTVRTARLGLVQGFAEGARAHARVLAASAPAWTRAVHRAVLPVPHGTTALVVNGQAVDPGLGGDQGWYALGKIRNGDAFELSLATGEAECVATIDGLGLGFLWMLR